MLRSFSASSSPSSGYNYHRHFHDSPMSFVSAAILRPTAACRRSFPSPLSTAAAAPLSAAVRRIGRGRRSGAVRIHRGTDANIHHTSVADRGDAESHPLPPAPEMPSLFQTLSPDQKDQISLYIRTLLHWNKRMNLTAVREEGDAMRRHVEDSLAMLSPIRRCYQKQQQQQLQEERSSCFRSVHNLRVIDIGTGAGLPGLIFAVACPGWRVTLLESMQKRCRFLENAVDLMGISNVHILCSRAESAGHELEFREAFDLAVARAVAEMRVLVEYSLPFVRVGGLFVAAKGHDPREEVKCAENAIQLMGSSILDLCTGYFFNARYFYRRDLGMKVELISAVQTVVTKLGGFMENQVRAMNEIQYYMDVVGSFGTPLSRASLGSTEDKGMHPVDSHSPHGQRTAIICRKDRLTPKVYPRPPGVPSKNPL